MDLPDNAFILVSQEQIEKIHGEVVAMRKHIEKTAHVSGIGFIPIKKACEDLDCSKAFIYTLIRKGILTHHKLGSRTFLSRTELEKVIEMGKD